MIRLTSREKLLGFTLAIFVAVWSLFAFAVNPVIDRIKTLNRLIPEKQKELQQLYSGSKKYIFLRDSLSRLHTKVASQQNDFELLSFLETLVRNCNLEKKIATMKQQVVPLDSHYSETIVEVKFQNLTLNQLVDFLQKVESSETLVKTKTLYIKKSTPDTDLLDSAVEIHSARLTQGQVARL